MRALAPTVFAFLALFACSRSYDSTPDPDPTDAGSSADAAVDADVSDTGPPVSSDAGTDGNDLPGTCATAIKDSLEDNNLSAAWVTTVKGSTSNLGYGAKAAPFSTTEGYLHAFAASEANMAGAAYIYQGFHASSLRQAKLEHDFAFNHLDGYSEFGCKLTYASDDGKNVIGVLLRANAPANGAPIEPYVAAAASSGAAAANDAVVATPVLSAVQFHRLELDLTVKSDASFVATASVDGSQTGSTTVAPLLDGQLSVVGVTCGVGYVDPSGNGLNDDVAIRNVTLTICQ